MSRGGEAGQNPRADPFAPFTRRSGLAFDEVAHGAVFRVALFEEGIGIEGAKGVEVAGEGFADGGGGGVRVAVGSPERFRHDFVGDALLHQFLGSELEGVGCCLGVFAVAPEDGGAAFRRDD